MVRTRPKCAAVAAIALAVCGPAEAKRAPIAERVGDPYAGAVVVDAESGEVLFEDRADAFGYPASVIKLMDLLVILDRIRAGNLRMEDRIPVPPEAMQMGGSQVYLDVREWFSVEDLLYALMVQSANDAAVALAMHVAGSKQAFVALMNDKARDLGMRHTRFHSVHGLPPAAGQQPDISTARDLATLSRAVAQYPEALRFTSTRERAFRGEEFIMRTHNALLQTVPGCDGLKTGYFRAAGFSVAATAERDGRRLIAVVLGSPSRKTRDAAAASLLAQGFDRR
jgi:D-alanyl-D-alanine carboxypeptidase (penicillin-binding protein 5/6)